MNKTSSLLYRRCCIGHTLFALSIAFYIKQGIDLALKARFLAPKEAILAPKEAILAPKEATLAPKRAILAVKASNFGSQGEQFGSQGEQFGSQGEQFGTQGEQFGTQGEQFGTQGENFGSQGDEQETGENNLDNQILQLIRTNGKITVNEMSKATEASPRTIYRRISEMPNIEYVGRGYSGHWVIKDKNND